tara:strand:- start:1846 stop:2235 length:390 start_codon:yes stop_codon:yes gene_type:complete
MSDEENKEASELTEEEQAAAFESVALEEFEEGTNTTDEGAPLSSEQIETEITAIHDVPVHVSAVLGSSSMQVSQLLKLSRGAVIELDRKVGEAIDIFVNNRLVARGEVVVVDDHLGITMTEIIKSEHVA